MAGVKGKLAVVLSDGQMAAKMVVATVEQKVASQVALMVDL